MRGFARLAGVVAFALSTTAPAATITVDWNSPVFSPGSVDVGTVTHPGGTTGTNAGRFHGKVTASDISTSELFQSADDFFAYCHDLAEYLGDGTYTVSYGASAVMLDFLGAVNSVLGGSVNAWISTSFSTVHAAVQLGIWEALYDGGFVLDSGPVRVVLANVPDAVETQFNAFIAAMGIADSLDGQYVMVLSARNNQDVITARTPTDQVVPEPATLSLLGIAVAAALAQRRR